MVITDKPGISQAYFFPKNITMGTLTNLIEHNVEHCVIKYNMTFRGIGVVGREFAIISCKHGDTKRLRSLGFRNEPNAHKFLLCKVMSEIEIRSFRKLLLSGEYKRSKSNKDGQVYDRTGRDFKRYYGMYFFDMFDAERIKRYEKKTIKRQLQTA